MALSTQLGNQKKKEYTFTFKGKFFEWATGPLFIFSWRIFGLASAV
jgi:hypothetical protein